MILLFLLTSLIMVNFTLDELILIAENRNIDRYKSMPKNQLINLFSAHVQRPMKPEHELMLKNFKRVHNQIEKKFKRKSKKIKISNLRHLFKEEDEDYFKPYKIQTV